MLPPRSLLDGVEPQESRIFLLIASAGGPATFVENVLTSRRALCACGTQASGTSAIFGDELTGFMRAIAEWTILGRSTSAECDGRFIGRNRILIAFRIDHFHGTFHNQRPMISKPNCYVCHANALSRESSGLNSIAPTVYWLPGGMGRAARLGRLTRTNGF